MPADVGKRERAKARKGEGAKGRRRESAKARKREGAKGRRRERAKARKGEGRPPSGERKEGKIPSRNTPEAYNVDNPMQGISRSTG